MQPTPAYTEVGGRGGGIGRARQGSIADMTVEALDAVLDAQAADDAGQTEHEHHTYASPFVDHTNDGASAPVPASSPVHCPCLALPG